MDKLKEMYRDYLGGKTDIKSISQQTLHDLIPTPDFVGNYLCHAEDLYTGFSVFDNGHSAIDSFVSEALAVGWLMDADVNQLDMVNRMLIDAKDKGRNAFESMEDALLSPAPEVKPAPSSIDDTLRNLNPNRASQIADGLYIGKGIYDPVHSIYAKPEFNEGDELARVTLYDVTLDDIEECMAHGTTSLSDVPDQIHVVDGTPAITSIDVDVYGAEGIKMFTETIADDARWCDELPLDGGGLEHYREIEDKNYRIEQTNGKESLENETCRDSWRDGMVSQVIEQMDAIEGNDLAGERDANSVLCDMFRNASGDWMTEAAKDVLEVYSRADDSARQGMADMFYALTGETFDSFLDQASQACEQTLGTGYEERDGGESLDEMCAAKCEEAELGDNGAPTQNDVDR